MNELLDIEGLRYLKWSMFDSKDNEGSGYRFMEREPVYVLDNIVAKYRIVLDIELGYVTPELAKDLRLASNDSHRVGKAVRIRCIGTKKRFMLVRGLIEFGVKRIAVSKETVYFDTDDLKERSFMLW